MYVQGNFINNIITIVVNVYNTFYVMNVCTQVNTF